MENEKLDYFKTKDASKVLDISISSMRLYAQTMEALGYEFKKHDNTRLFNKYDLLIIKRAMKRYKLVGGTMQESFRYMIISEQHGEEKAQEFIDKLNAEKRSDENNDNKQNDVYEIAKSVSSMMLDENQLYYNKLTDQIEELKKQNHMLKENENWKEKYYQSENRRIEAENKLKHLSLMNYRQFKEWKKQEEL